MTQWQDIVKIFFCSLLGSIFLTCSESRIEHGYYQLNLDRLTSHVINAPKEKYVWVFLYVNENGCQTCNLDIMNQLDQLTSLEGYQFLGYFATNSAYWKRIVKSMNLGYKIHFGEGISKIEKLLCDDGKILLISTDISGRYQKVCNFDELLASLQSIGFN